MARRRAKGEGSITKRKDGRWQAAVTIGYDEQGKQLRRYLSGKTQAEVRTKMDAIKQQLGMGTLPTEDPTLAEYLERWLKEKERQVKPRTIESYRYTVKRYILPKLGRAKLSKLTPLKLQTAIGEIADAISPVTGNYCRSVLFMALDQAVKWRLLVVNPVAAVDRLRQEKREMTIWTTDQITKFITQAQEHRLYALFYLLITSGLRIGEVLGLQWGDLKNNALHVRRTLGRQNGRLTLATTKTSKGQRIVTLAPDALAVLEQHRQRQTVEKQALEGAWERPEQIFVTEIGTFLDQRNVTRVWHRLQEQAGVPRARLHDARHLHVSLLVRHGLDARTIADRVGHTNPAFTLRQYTHLFEEQRLAAAVPLAELLATRENPEGENSEAEALEGDREAV